MPIRTWLVTSAPQVAGLLRLERPYSDLWARVSLFCGRSVLRRAVAGFLRPRFFFLPVAALTTSSPECSVRREAEAAQAVLSSHHWKSGILRRCREITLRSCAG